MNQTLLTKGEPLSTPLKEGIQHTEKAIRETPAQKCGLSKDELRFFFHDFKSPLKRIESLSDLVISHVNDPEFFNYVSFIENELLLFQRYVEGLSALKHTDEAKCPIPEVFDFSTILNVLENSFKEVGSLKEITVTFDHFPQKIYLNTDPLAINRILDNLISNAIKFSPKRGAITVQVRKEGNDLLLKVSDNGPGIKKAEQKFIFEKFRKGSSRPTAHEPTSGIGLYLVKTLTEKLGGTVTLSSKVNQGSTFKVNLPGVVVAH